MILHVVSAVRKLQCTDGLQQEVRLRKGPEGCQEWPWAGVPGFLGLRLGRLQTQIKMTYEYRGLYPLLCPISVLYGTTTTTTMTSLSYLSFLRIQKKSAVLYKSITLIALHLLIAGAPSIFDWLQNLHWIRGKPLTSLSHWSPTYRPICINFFEWRLLSMLKYPTYTLLLVWGSQKSKPGLEWFWSHFIMSSAWPPNSQTGGPLSTWGSPESARPEPEPV